MGGLRLDGTLTKIKSLRALRDKYAEMLRMRTAHDAGTEIDPKGDMQRLASRFPGALREIDRHSIAVIQDRMRELDEALERDGRVPPWAEYAHAYHGWMRALLVLRSLIGDERDAVHVREKVRARYQEQFDREAEFDFDDADLSEVLTLEGGRMNPWVFARIARDCGVAPEHVEATIFIG